nr:hypothetical protein [Tanacetum cinerariifolium]
MVVSSSPVTLQAIQTILLGLPEDIYVAVDSCETAQEIWFLVQQMMKGSDIGIQEKKAKLFNEWERAGSTPRILTRPLMINSFQKGSGSESRPPMLNKENYVPWSSRLLRYAKSRPNGKIIHNSILNGPYPEWSRHVTIVHHTKDLHTTDYTQLYDFLKYNQKEVAQNPRVQNVGNQNGLIGVQGNGIQNQIGNGNLVAVRADGNASGQNANQIRRRDAAYLQTQLLIAQKEEAGIQLQEDEYDLMAAAADLDEIEKVNANCILMANL